MKVPAVTTPVRNRYFFGSDMLLLPIAAYLSFVIRLEVFDLGEFWSGYLLFLIIGLLVTPWVFRRFGVYSRYWRYASIDELILLSGSVIISCTIVSAAALVAADLMPGVVVPRSVPVVYFFLALIAAAGPRLVSRLHWRFDVLRRKARIEPGAHKERVLIVGAGNVGTLIARELRNNPQLGQEMVGFVDDDPLKQKVHIYGAPVLGTRQHIARLVSEHSISQVIIAMSTAPGKTIRLIVSQCERVGVRTRIMPSLYELLDGKIGLNQLRDVQIEDLLRRKPVHTNIGAVEELLRGRRVLITGGGGSIGSEICRQVLRCEPAQLIILGHGENSVFTIEHELRKQLPPTTELITVIADIRFGDRIQAIMARHRPEIVFHAAAHKHVPLMEANPVEAITNNVLGTRNLLNAAIAADVKHFVMISTDKAVNPTSIMGASKRVAELLVHQAATYSGKPFLAVRFGNVLGSRGSVVLTFKQQISAGGPVTVTHPEMVRYFMTIPEATQLTLQAATLGHGGEVFTLDMGEPVKIVDLARDMIELSGLEVGRDIDISFTGLRPGEKLYEELFIDGENYERTFHEKIFIACNASHFVPITLDDHITTLELAAEREDVSTILRVLHRLIPSFHNPAIDEPKPQPEEHALGEIPLRARTVGD